MTFVALIAATLVATVPPVFYFYFGFQYQRGSLVFEANVRADKISQMIGRNPYFWQFEMLKLSEILISNKNATQKNVLNENNELVFSSGPDTLLWPVISKSVRLYDSGQVAGTLVVERSLRASLYNIILLAVFSLVAAVFVFAAFLGAPLAVLKKVSEQARFLASHDPLTDLPNRGLFRDWLERSIKESLGSEKSLAVICFDLDYFKDVNDTLGHAAGDDVLRAATKRILGLIRKPDMLARLGGDEFAVIQKDAKQPEASARLAAEVIHSMSNPFSLDGTRVHLGASAGIALLTAGENLSSTTLLQQADVALYKSKALGRGRFTFLGYAVDARAY